MFLVNHDHISDCIGSRLVVPARNDFESVLKLPDRQQDFQPGRKHVRRLRLAAIRNLESAIGDLTQALTDRENTHFATLDQHPDVKRVLVFLTSLFTTEPDGRIIPSWETVSETIMCLIRGNLVGPKAVVYANGAVE